MRDEWLTELGKVALAGGVGLVLFLVRSYVRSMVTEVRLLRRQMGKVLQRLVRHDMRLRVLEGRDGPAEHVLATGGRPGPDH